MNDKVLYIRCSPELHKRVTTETTRRLRYGQPAPISVVARALLIERLDQLDSPALAAFIPKKAAKKGRVRK